MVTSEDGVSEDENGDSLLRMVTLKMRRTMVRF